MEIKNAINCNINETPSPSNNDKGHILSKKGYATLVCSCEVVLIAILVIDAIERPTAYNIFGDILLIMLIIVLTVNSIRNYK